jgi:hypothetical protein
MSKCKFKVVKEVWLDENEVVLIHSPEFWYTATELEEWLRERGVKVRRLNTGVREEAEEAEKLLELCFQSTD